MANRAKHDRALYRALQHFRNYCSIRNKIPDRSSAELARASLVCNGRMASPGLERPSWSCVLIRWPYGLCSWLSFHGDTLVLANILILVCRAVASNNSFNPTAGARPGFSDIQPRRRRANSGVRHRMKVSIAFISLLASSAYAAAAPPSPLPSGQYTFQHKFAEQPNLPSVPMLAKINGLHIVLVNRARFGGFPKGVVADGILMWHAASKQWIIGHKASDRNVKEVGGCSGGPDAIDLQKKIYWTC